VTGDWLELVGASGFLSSSAGPLHKVRLKSGLTNVFKSTVDELEVVGGTLLIVGNQTLYKRGNQWFAANAKDVDLKRDADKIKIVQRFSDEYFKLIEANTANENAVLARQQNGEELIIRLRGQIYLIR